MRSSALSDQRKPAMTQSAVRCCFTLTTPSREPGRYGRSQPLRDDAVEADRVDRREPLRRPRRARASAARA